MSAPLSRNATTNDSNDVDDKNDDNRDHNDDDGGGNEQEFELECGRA